MGDKKEFAMKLMESFMPHAYSGEDGKDDRAKLVNMKECALITVSNVIIVLIASKGKSKELKDWQDLRFILDEMV